MKKEYPLYIFGAAELGLLKLIEDGYEGKVKLIYLDPPYFTGSGLNNPDKDEKIKEKAKTDFKRVIESSKNLLSEDGFLILHSNYQYSANFLNQLFDVFGETRLINEIIWQYRKSSFSRLMTR